MFKNIGTTEIIVIAVVLLFLSGGKKLIDLAQGLGEAKKELKKVKEELQQKKKGERRWKFMFRGIGTTEVIIIALVLLLFFGGKKIPEFIKGIGEAVKEFKKASKEKEEE